MVWPTMETKPSERKTGMEITEVVDMRRGTTIKAATRDLLMQATPTGSDYQYQKRDLKQSISSSMIIRDNIDGDVNGYVNPHDSEGHNENRSRRDVKRIRLQRHLREMKNRVR